MPTPPVESVPVSFFIEFMKRDPLISAHDRAFWHGLLGGSPAMPEPRVALSLPVPA